MKFSSILLLWTIAIALGLTVFSVQSSKNKTSTSFTSLASGDKILPDVDLSKLTNLKIEDTTHTTTLLKKNNLWLISEKENFPADTRQLSEILDALLGSKVAQSLEAGLSYNSRFGIDLKSSNPEKRGLTLTLSEGKKSTTLHLGKDASTNGLGTNGSSGNGRYLRLNSDPLAVYAITESLPTLSANPTQWLTQDAILKITNIQTISLTAPNDPSFQNWTVSRKTAESEFTLQGLKKGQSTNPATTTPLKELLANPRFVDVLNKEKATEQATKPQDNRQATITTFDGFTYTLNIRNLKTPNHATAPGQAKPTPGNLLSYTITYNAPESAAQDNANESDQMLKQKFVQEQAYENCIYQLNNWDLQALLKTKSDFLTKPSTPEPTPIPPAQTVPPAPE